MSCSHCGAWPSSYCSMEFPGDSSPLFGLSSALYQLGWGSASLWATVCVAPAPQEHCFLETNSTGLRGTVCVWWWEGKSTVSDRSHWKPVMWFLKWCRAGVSSEHSLETSDGDPDSETPSFSIATWDAVHCKHKGILLASCWKVEVISSSQKHLKYSSCSKNGTCS